MKNKPLYRRYRYKTDRYTPRVWLVASPDYGPEAATFHYEIHKIANKLFNYGRPGGALNSVCTAQFGGVIFQAADKELNTKRARLVTSIWRTWQRYKVKGCTCRIAGILRSSGSLIPRNNSNCPIHG